MTELPPIPDYLTFELTAEEEGRPVRWRIPLEWRPGDHVSRCRSCDARIVWCVTPRGKRAPVNPDATSHFASCPDADRWRKRP